MMYWHRWRAQLAARSFNVSIALGSRPKQANDFDFVKSYHLISFSRILKALNGLHIWMDIPDDRTVCCVLVSVTVRCWVRNQY